MDHQDVARLDLVAGVALPLLEVLGAVELVVPDAHLLEVDHACGSDEVVEGVRVDPLAAGEEVSGSIEVGADVECCAEVLAARAIEREVLDPLDLGAGIAGERRRVPREVLREIDDLLGVDVH